MQAAASVRAGGVSSALAKLDQAAQAAFLLGWGRGQIEAKLAALRLLRTAPDPAYERRLLSEVLQSDVNTLAISESATLAARLGRLEVHRAPRAALHWLLEARALFSAARQVSERSVVANVQTLALLADVQAHLGLPLEALRSADAALRMAESAALAENERADAYQAYGRAMWAVGRHDEAAKYMRLVLDALGEDGGVQAAGTLGNLARIHLEKGDFESAARLYARVLASPAMKQDRSFALLARLHKAAATIERPKAQRTPAALRGAYLACRQIATDADAIPSDVSGVGEISVHADALAARALNLLGQHARARTLLRDLAVRDDVKASNELLGFVYRELAAALRASGAFGEAVDAASMALSSFESLLRTMPQTYALSLLSNDAYRLLASVAVGAAHDLGDPRTIRQTLERTRGVAFLNEVLRRRRLRATGREVGVSASALSDAVAVAAKRYYRARSSGKRSDTAQARGALWRARLALREAREQAEVRSSPARAASPSRPVAGLRAGEAMLYLGTDEDRYLAIVDHSARIESVVRALCGMRTFGV